MPHTHLPILEHGGKGLLRQHEVPGPEGARGDQVAAAHGIMLEGQAQGCRQPEQLLLHRQVCCGRRTTRMAKPRREDAQECASGVITHAARL